MKRQITLSLGTILTSLLLIFSLPLPTDACTSVIVSGKVTIDGRPVMMKNRDTGQINNRIEYFKGEKYDFVALVNSDWRENPSSALYGWKGEAWSGTNSVGFCIMNTATYDLKDDDVPVEQMEREGVLMYRALEVCATINDFEHFLDTLSRPMGVEANFGVIDAHGGASYYEVNNSRWVKFDVNDLSGGKKGYRVVTNFTTTGRFQDRKGVDRYEKASDIMAKYFSDIKVSGGRVSNKVSISHRDLINMIPRSGTPILRDITSSVVVFEGVTPGENPLHTVMWSVVGYPASAVAIPVMVLTRDLIPDWVKASPSSPNCKSCDTSLSIKKRIGEGAVDMTTVIKACVQTEKVIDRRFQSIYDRWIQGKISDRNFESLYESATSKFSSLCRKNLAPYGK